MAVQIVEDLCTACGDCEPECPTASISPKRGVFTVKESTCTECDPDYDSPKCMDVCDVDDCIVYV